MKDSKIEPFWKACKKHKHLGFDGIIFLAYVAEFEAQGLRCFVSRAKIAEDLPISESGARYLIKRLVSEGYLFIRYEGRKRYLSTINTGGKIKPDETIEGANSAPKGGTIKPDEGAELNQIRGHERTNTKNHNKQSLQRNKYKEDLVLDYDNTKREEPMTKEEQEERERLLRLAKLSSEGWQDKGTYLEKWDEATRTMIRQNKLVHNPQRWNHDSYD